MIPSGRLNGYSVNTLRDVLVSSADADSTEYTLRCSTTLFQGADENLCSNLISLTPRECVVDFTAALNTHAVGDLLVTMPNVEGLYLIGSVVSDMFLRPDPLSYTKLLPSLRRLSLEDLTLPSDDDWNPLITYPTYQTSGGQTISFRLCGEHPTMPAEVVREIMGLVVEFNFGHPDGGSW